MHAILLPALGLLNVACLTFVAVYALRLMVLTAFALRSAPQGLPAMVGDTGLPFVTVQLPLYNEPAVARRVIDAASALDWPTDRLEIQILDDSTDHTRRIVDRQALRWRQNGRTVNVIRRADREGFKAGALRQGTAVAQGEFIAIFDADFLPAADFLRRAMPYFGPRTCAVQARWSHLNDRENLLTRVQALALDGYFMIEQRVLSERRGFLTFNGSAGIWRKAAIVDAGDWSGDTVAEDTDLSYRALLAGWRIHFVSQLDVPAELPASIPGLKTQQYRWAAGTTQVLLKLARPILRSGESRWRKAVALSTLGRHLSHIVMLLLLLSAPAMWLAPLPLGVAGGAFWLIPLSALSFYGLAQRSLYADWKQRLLIYPLAMILNLGMSANNAVAVLAALAGRRPAFERTEKRGAAEDRPRSGGRQGPGGSGAAFHRGRVVALLELSLGAYATAGLGLALAQGAWGPALLLGLFSAGYTLVIGLGLMDLLRGSQISLGRRWAGEWTRRRGRLDVSHVVAPGFHSPTVHPLDDAETARADQ